MTKVGTDENGKTIYGYNLPDSLDTLSDVKVIFSNGSSQYPAASGSTDGLDWTTGKSYVLYGNSTELRALWKQHVRLEGLCDTDGNPDCYGHTEADSDTDSHNGSDRDADSV